MTEITNQHISLYEKYSGDIDGLLHVGSPDDRAAISADVWREIESLCQSIVLYKRGLLTVEASQELLTRLRTSLVDEASIEQLMNTALETS
jgi:hypothetical protein